MGMTHCWISLGSFPGGADKNVVVFDKSSEQILATLKGHTKKVTSVVFHPSQVEGPASHPGSLIPAPWFRWFRVADPVTQHRAVSLRSEVGPRRSTEPPERALQGLCLQPWVALSSVQKPLKQWPSAQGRGGKESWNKQTHRHVAC